MSKQMNDSISATNLATRVINEQLYAVKLTERVQDTKNAKPLELLKKAQPLSVNQGLISPTKNAQLLYRRDLNAKQIGNYEHNRFANEVECMDGQQLRVITARRVMMCFITTLAAASIIFLTRHN